MKRKYSDCGLQSQSECPCLVNPFNIKKCLQSFHAHVKRSRIVSEVENYKLHSDKEIHTCTLCLESPRIGDNVVRLECGHVFHCGALTREDRQREGTCRGIIHWLANKRTCPNCRTSIIPLAEKISSTKASTEPNQVKDSIRMDILEKISRLCVEAVVTYDPRAVKKLTQDELYRYNRKTAARVELALLARSNSLQSYVDEKTLRYRVFLEIESLISRRILDIYAKPKIVEQTVC